MTTDTLALKAYINQLKLSAETEDFIQLNSYLIQKSSELEKKDLLITLKSRRELPVFLKAILAYSEQKYAFIEKNKLSAQLNDLVLYQEKVWKVTQIEEEKATIQELIEKKPKSVVLTELSKINNDDTIYQQSRKIRIDFSKPDLKIISYYEGYCNWLTAIKQKYTIKNNSNEILNQKEGKVLIISPDNGYYNQINKYYAKIPFSCNELLSASCTSYDPIVDIFSKFDIAQNSKQIQQTYNEIFIIGDKNILNHLSDIIRLVNRGWIERFVLIGTEKPEMNYPLTEWHWTKEEYNLWNNKPISGDVRLKITGEATWNSISNGVDELKKLVNEIINITQSIRQNYIGIHLEKVYYFINEYLRYLLPPNHQYLHEINQKTCNYLHCEEFKDAFYEKAIYDQQTIMDWAIRLDNAFEKLNQFFQKNSPKFIHIQSSLKNKEDFQKFSGGRYVLATRDMLDKCQGTLGLHNQEQKIGSVPLFDTQSTSFDQIVDSDLNTPNAQFIFPFIFNRAQLETMLEANGDVKLYLYKDIEEFKYVKVLESHQRKFLNKVQHSDRKLFFDCEYIVNGRLAQEASIELNLQSDTFNEVLIREFEALESSQRDFFEQLYNVDDFDYQYETREYRSHDISEYEITFEDNEVFVFPGFRRIILIEYSEGNIERYLEIPSASIQKGQDIIVYRNQNKDLLYDILKNQDTSGLMQEIERASNLWFSTIKEIVRRIDGNYSTLEQIFVNEGIHLTHQTLHGYLQHERKFPKETEILEAIRLIAINNDLSNSYLTQPSQLENILKRKKQYLSLSITLGRGISDEIIRHYLTGEKGELLEKLDNDVFEVLKLNVKQGKVKSIAKKN
jgi:hypothetical protein